MAQITGGKVSFARSVQPAQYETKKAEVELTFTLVEGEALNGFLDSVAAQAQAKALEMIGLKTAPIAKTETTKPAEVKPAQTKEEYAAKQAAEQHGSAEKAVAAKKAAKAEAEKANTAKPPADDLSIPGFLDRTQPTAQSDPDADLLADASKEITDQELVAAVTNTNAIVKDPKKIHELREKFVKLPKGLRDIPQVDRPAFMEGLAKLKASVKG